MLKLCTKVRFYCNKSNGSKATMKYLNVAEKNDAAKTISSHLSHGSSHRREGLSKFNKIYEFEYNVLGNQNAKMVMTSVSGHLLTHEFGISFRNWQNCDPIKLFEAPVSKYCPDNFIQIKKTLEREVRGSNGLIIWTDCDREGENIGFEIIDVCRAIKPNLPVYRAKFSEITSQAVKRALNNLEPPDDKQSKAVDVRSELDLRIGAAFTRFQTMRYQRLFPNIIERRLISYGSCQTPTLGFVAKRFKEAENFQPQLFWKIRLTHKVGELIVEFHWSRNRLFDQQCCQAILDLCRLVDPLRATVTNVTLKPKSKWRPQPMDTIALEKLGSKKLKLSAKTTMTIAEKLYTKGFISYPRTETNMFSNEINLRPLVEQQTSSPKWGEFANRVLEWGITPRNGNKSDKAHPPIHPTKSAENLQGDEGKVYELIVRHFLACISRDATGSETIVNATIDEEEFTATGLCIHERNYLDVYIYEKWNAKEIHDYKRGQKFEPTELSLKEGSTTAPEMLTEAELISMMDKHGIGTDATHAEHINTIMEREYIGKIDGGYLVPGTLGMALVEGYESVDLPLAEPNLRAGLERELKGICDGIRDPQEVLSEQIKIYRNAFRLITEKVKKLDESIGKRLNAEPVANAIDRLDQEQRQQQIQSINTIKCNKCDSFMSLKLVNEKLILACQNYPMCRNTIWFPMNVIKDATVSSDYCPKCGPNYKKIKFKLKSFRHTSSLNQRNVDTDDALMYTTCLICDYDFQELCDINLTGTSSNLSSVANGGSGGSGDSRGGSSNTGSGNSRGGSDNSRGGSGNSRGGNSNSNNGRAFDRELMPTPSELQSQNRTIHRPQLPSAQTAPTTPSTRLPLVNVNRRPPEQSGHQSNEVYCTKCRKLARKLIVKKDTPNKGRAFFTCEQECNFFEWADDAAGSNNRAGSSSSNVSTGRTINYGRSDDDNNDDDGGGGSSGNTSRAKRKCSSCRQEGHTRNKCPRLRLESGNS